MKRAGNLMGRITEMSNLQEAFLRAARGKSGKKEVVAFRSDLDSRLMAVRSQLLDGSYRFGHYHFFTVFDPKRRTICAASFEERVVFHAMMRICHPVFDKYQIFDSYASRIGKGTYKALERACEFCQRYEWFAKLDMQKYFDSISHERMMRQLCRLFKDPQLLLFFRQLLDTYEVTPGRGLPIGNLTSQYFANHFLSPADHYAKEQLHVAGMVRYMDDVLIFSNSRSELLEQVRKYSDYVVDQLLLSIHEPIINRCAHGIPFLGYTVYSNGLRLNLRSRRRFARKMACIDRAYWLGQMDGREASSRAQCLLAFVDKADSLGYRRRLYHIGQYS